MNNKKTYKSKYVPVNPHKYKGDIEQIICRSSWERKFCQYLDHVDEMVGWASEPFHIDYYSTAEKKARRYFPDFWVKIRHGSGKEEIILIEIKPNKERSPPKTRNKKQLLTEMLTYKINQDKWAAAEIFCAEQGWTFLVMDEFNLGIVKRTPSHGK